MNDPTTIRNALPTDVESIRQIVYTAISWNPEEFVPPLEAVVDHPEVARYHTGWGRAGDFGILAELGGVVVGGAFGRTFTEDDHGHGYVDEDIPELAIAVWGAARGEGLGTRLLEAFHEEALANQFTTVSLSMNQGNPAITLYERAGYQVHSADSGSVRMVISLGD